jgi:hypothetical protein
MRQVAILVAAAALAGTVGACADPYYGYRTRTYAYSSDYYYPNYYYPSRPVYYSTATPYYYGYAYGSTWDYYRNYNGIHSRAEVNAL